MDDRMSATTRGGQLLHAKSISKQTISIAAYGDGDGNGLALTPVTNPQISRRV